MKTFCAYFNQGICRSCTEIERPYEAQAEEKARRLRAILGDAATLPLVASAPTGFRNKAKFVVTGTLERPIIGLAGESDKDQGREILNCPLHLPWINQTVTDLLPLLQAAKLAPYSIGEKKGELKGIILFYAAESNEGYVRLVLRSKEAIDRIRKHLPAWLGAHPAVASFSVNIQPIPHAILEGPEEIYLHGQTVRLRLNHLDVPISPQGFVQTNQAVARELYSEARHWVRELKIKKFLELFSGQGAFSFYVHDVVAEGLGVELNPEAAKSAASATSTLGIRNLRFVAKDAKDVEGELKSFAPNLLLVNPPRRGLGESLELIRRARVPYLIYSSCSIESLERDLRDLGPTYDVVRAKPFDMFPQSEHFETLVLLKLSASGKNT